jgi:hypothetical protein
MKAVLNRSGAIASYLNVWTIREPSDWEMTYTWTICIRDSNNNVVFSQQFYHAVGTDPDVKLTTFNLTNLQDGEYKVDLYIWSDCNPPEGVTTYSYYIHKVSNVSTLVLSSDVWSSDTRVFILYVYDGKLFWIYDVDVTGTPIPIGIPVYAEITDGAGNAFVGSITASDMATYIEPNMRVPFMATYTIKVDQPRAGDVVGYVKDVIGFMHGVTFQVVDDYTFNIVIAKTEPGIPVMAIVAIALAVAAIVWAVAWAVVRVNEINLQAKALDSAKPAVDIASQAYQMYINEVSRCRKDDLQCIQLAQYKWFPIIQQSSALAGKILAAGLPAQPTTCNGLNVSGVCIPWWVVGLMVFVGALMVISALK